MPPAAPADRITSCRLPMTSAVRRRDPSCHCAGCCGCCCCRSGWALGCCCCCRAEQLQLLLLLQGRTVAAMPVSLRSANPCAENASGKARLLLLVAVCIPQLLICELQTPVGWEVGEPKRWCEFVDVPSYPCSSVPVPLIPGWWLQMWQQLTAGRLTLPKCFIYPATNCTAQPFRR